MDNHMHWMRTHDRNASVYTLNTLEYRDDTASDTAPLVSPETPSYGATCPRTPCIPTNARIVLNATLKMALVFIVSTLFLSGTLWLALPTLDLADRPLLRIPKSFQQLKELNGLLSKYRDIYPYRILVCFVITYLFLQAFSLPGSMYLSILGGAMWGVARTLPLVCCCVATGATLCYLISSALGPALLTLPKWKAVLDKWATKIRENKDNIISFLIVLRIMPLPPHWVINIVCPHVGIGIVPFWISTWLGVLGVSVIHTTIGSGLEEMTSAEDFHLISLRNFFGLAAVVIGVMIPVGLRYWFRREVQSIAEVGNDGDDEGDDDPDRGQDRIIATGPGTGTKTGEIQSLLGHESLYNTDSEDSDGDVILEAGPSIFGGDKNGIRASTDDIGSSSRLGL